MNANGLKTQGRYQRQVNGMMLIVIGRDLHIAGTEDSYRFASGQLARLACATWDGTGEPPYSEGVSPRCCCCGRVLL